MGTTTLVVAKEGIHSTKKTDGRSSMFVYSCPTNSTAHRLLRQITFERR